MVGNVSEISSRSRPLWLGALLLVLLTLLVFARVLRADFVLWDDDILIYRNPHLTGFNAATVKWAFTDFQYVVRYHPLTWLTWAGVQGASGGNPQAYHLVNLVFHCLNVCLVFLLICKVLVHWGGET